MMRSGPKPLPFQLGMASLAAAGMAGGTPFDAQTLQDYFKGIQKYQAHPFKRAMPPLEVVWQAGQASLFMCNPSGQTSHQTPIVLIPSMVNKSDILDLAPDRSMLRWLAAQGFRTYLFDWGQPTKDAGQKTFDLAVSERLIPALSSIGGPSHLLGYCMGGLFAAAISTLRPDLAKSLLLLATPWNFHDALGAMRARISLMKPMAIPHMKQHNLLPESWMQAVFATLDPESSIRKFANFAAIEESDPRAKIFVAVEDWLNEGVDLPSAIALSCMEDWYEHNKPMLGTWEVCGQAIKAADIRVPTMVAAATQDKIVPLESAIAFADQRVKGDKLVCNTGHIGLIAGGKVVEEVWKPAAQWFASQQ